MRRIPQGDSPIMATKAHSASTSSAAGPGSVRVLVALVLIAGSFAHQTVVADPALASEVSVGPSGTASACPSGWAIHDVTITNESTKGNDTFALTATHSAAWRVELRSGATTLAIDETGDGTWEAVAAGADSDGDGLPDTGRVAAQTSVSYQVAVHAPGGSEGNEARTSLLAVSANDHTHLDAAVLATSVRDCVPPSIDITASASPGSLYETGGTPSFAIDVVNTSGEPLTITSLVNSVFGNLLDPANALVDSGTNTCPAVATTVAAGAAFSCSFDATLSDDGTGIHTNTTTATAVDSDLQGATSVDIASVTFSNLLPAISVSASASPAALDVPGTVTFTVELSNTSGERVTLTELSDSAFGNLLDGANGAIASNTCDDIDPSIISGNSVACSYEADLADGGTGPHLSIVTATVVDDQEATASDMDAASVAFDSTALAIDVELSLIHI